MTLDTLATPTSPLQVSYGCTEGLKIDPKGKSLFIQIGKEGIKKEKRLEVYFSSLIHIFFTLIFL